jgi:TolA-binding protein
MENTGKTAPESPFSWRTFSEDLWFRHSRALVAAAVILVAIVVGWFGWSSMRESRAEAENKRLGAAYVLLREDNSAAAEQALRAFLAEKPSGLARDKANLFLGKLLYRQERYDEALQAYGQVEADGKSLALIGAGALHGRAAVYMQMSDYARAAELLDELVKTYGARTGDPRENLAGEEVVDFSPNVPNALWKLALCRRELGEADKARVAAERLVRAYPGSREAMDAEKLLVTL